VSQAPVAPHEGGLRIGTFAGAPIIVESTFLLLGLYVLGSAVLSGGISSLPSAALYLAAIVLAVLIHELGHAGVAALLRIPSKRIVLTFFGGYVQFALQPKARWHEIAVSAAGPLANLATWGIIVLAVPFIAPISGTELNWVAVTIGNLAYISLLLGLLNLLPGFPLDGGHILRALLSYAMSRPRAGSIAGGFGLLLAIALGVYAAYAQMWWTLMIAVLLALAAWAEMQRSLAALQAPPSTTSNA
jgi:Zn-dependent protease